MAKRLLRNIAVTIGAGLAWGIGRKLVARRSDPAPNLSPILSRLESIESRVMRVELSPTAVTGSAPEEIEALGTLVSSQSEDIAALRHEIERLERRNAEQTEVFGQKVALLEQQLPVHIETSVTSKMADLEDKLRGEFRDIHNRTVEAFVETIEKRVVGRIHALEASLAEQSKSIVSLNEKSMKTDDNLQKLLEAMEKLCARAEAQLQVPLVQHEEAPVAAAPEIQPESFASVLAAVTAEQPQGNGTDVQREPYPETPPLEDPAAQYQRALDRDVKPEPQFTFKRGNSVPHPPALPKRDYRPMGMAILGLAVLGFRYIR